MIVVAVLVAGPARAQVRYDVSALASFSQRLADTAEGGGLLVDGHVAVLPLLRVGAYASGELSERLSGADALRGILGGGLRIKVVPPWPRGAWRMWFATGFGYEGVITDGPGGGYFEVPVWFGASYRLRKPFVFVMELGARLGFAEWGSYYASGSETVAITLSLGIGIDR